MVLTFSVLVVVWSTLLSILLLLLPGRVDALKVAGEMATSESWRYLERYAFVPAEGFEAYMGSTGAGYATWEIYHNLATTSSGLWLLGYPVKSLSNWQTNMMQKGGSDMAHSSDGLSCSERIAEARIRFKINGYNSVPFDINSLDDNSDIPPKKKDVEKYKYKWSTRLRITREELNRDSPKMVYWALAHCALQPVDAAKVVSKSLSSAVQVAGLQPYSAAWNETYLYGLCNFGPSQAHCQGSLEVFYNGHFTLEFEGERLSRSKGGTFVGSATELSFDAIGFGGILLVIGVIQLVIVVPTVVLVGLALWAKQRLHLTVWLLFVAIALFTVGFLFLMGYSLYGNTGHVASLNVALAGHFIQLFGDACLLFLFLCLSGGWTVTRRKLTMLGRVRLTVFLVSYTTCRFAALQWYSFTAGSGEYYLTESSAGLMSIVLLCLACLRFTSMTFVARRKWPEHAVFFFRLRIIGIIYMLHLPFLALVTSRVADMFRLKAVLIGNQVPKMVCQFALLLMYHPRLFPASFPFHAQIEDMKTYKMQVASNEMDDIARSRQEREDNDDGNKVSVLSFTGGGAGSYAERVDGNGVGGVAKSVTASVSGSAAGGGGGKASAPKSFTGGTAQNALTVDAEGRFRPPSYFDRQQLSAIKDATKEVDLLIASLNNYSHSLHDILAKMNSEESEISRTERDLVSKAGSTSEDYAAFSRFRKEAHSQVANTSGMSQDGKSFVARLLKKGGAAVGMKIGEGEGENYGGDRDMEAGEYSASRARRSDAPVWAVATPSKLLSSQPSKRSAPYASANDNPDSDSTKVDGAAAADGAGGGAGEGEGGSGDTSTPQPFRTQRQMRAAVGDRLWRAHEDASLGDSKSSSSSSGGDGRGRYASSSREEERDRLVDPSPSTGRAGAGAGAGLGTPNYDHGYGDEIEEEHGGSEFIPLRTVASWGKSRKPRVPASAASGGSGQQQGEEGEGEGGTASGGGDGTRSNTDTDGVPIRAAPRAKPKAPVAGYSSPYSKPGEDVIRAQKERYWSARQEEAAALQEGKRDD